jgi:predicted dinucleotide-binding enzyme
MNIGIIGCGPMGLAMADLWAHHGHQVCLSYSRHPAKLAALARIIGPSARVGSPMEAAQFGQVVALAVPWSLSEAVLAQVRPFLTGKTLLSCVVPWDAGRSGLVVGTSTSAAEQIAALIPEAHVVEVLPVLADGLAVPTGHFGCDSPTLLYCGDHIGAKAKVVELWEGIDVELVDAGPLWSARFLEPATALLWHLGVGLGTGTDIALKLLRRIPPSTLSYKDKIR